MKRPNRFMGPSLYDTEVKVGTHAVDGGWPAGKNVYVDAAGNGCDPDADPTSSDDSLPDVFLDAHGHVACHAQLHGHRARPRAGHAV